MKGDKWLIPKYGTVEQTCDCELRPGMIRVLDKGPNPRTDFECPKCGAPMPYIKPL